ncbi:hypothetical protein ACMD2_15286 [Ananas comosus]|uniref:Uncharacterized protein n=1 Tax=Ananas comosus TaxID=4615 RepID=A0A199UKW5_ANACO|nr:hypothetical protein ACMD2_15286 [Ananas comosus]
MGIVPIGQSAYKAMSIRCFGCFHYLYLRSTSFPNLTMSDIIELFPDPLLPTKARLLPASTCKLKFRNTVTQGLVGYLKLTSLNSICPRIFSGSIDSSGFISIFLSSREKTVVSACDPFTMSGVRARVSAMLSAVITNTMKDLMILPKSDSRCLRSCEEYQRPTIAAPMSRGNVAMTTAAKRQLRRNDMTNAVAVNINSECVPLSMTFPFFRTIMLSAFLIVDSLCATTTVVLSNIIFSKAC